MAGEVLILDYYGAALNVLCQQAAKGPPIVIGETSRAWAGNERSSIRGEKRTWNIRTIKIPTETENAIQAMIARRNQFYAGGEAMQLNPIIDPLLLSSTQWIRASVNVAPGIADPNGGLAAQTITATAGAGNLLQTLSNAAALARTNRLWIRRRTGSGNIDLRVADGSGWTTQAISATWLPYTVVGGINVARSHGLRVVTNGDAVDVYNASMTADPVLVSAICNSSDMQAGTYLFEMSLTLFEV